MAPLLLISSTLNKTITAFSWMLIHSLWQGLVLAIIAAMLLWLAKKSAPAYRYNLALILFVAFIGTCACTFLVEWNNYGRNIIHAMAGGAVPVLSLFSNIYEFKHVVKVFSAYFSANAPLVVLIWSIFFLFKSMKMVSCLVYNHRVKTIKVFRADDFWVDAVENFSKKLGINKTVKLLQSGYVKMPVVIGHLKPVILIPIGLMGGLPAEQVEAILLHELAHIRRNDYFVNFLQNIAETVFFFNPGLLWISSLSREERENCCDDIALEQTQNKKGFVQALISFKEHELYGTTYATAFPGKKNYLMRRVSRILGNEHKIFGFGEKIFFIVTTILLAFVTGALAFGQLKPHVKSRTAVALYKTVHNPITSGPALGNRNALSHSISLKHKNTGRGLEMKDGIPAIRRQPSSSASAEVPEVIEPVVVRTEKKQTVIIRIKAEQDRNEAMVKLPLTPQEEAERDQLQAKKDQAQAALDQISALNDQKQAKIDQQQAEKDQKQALLDHQEALKGRDAESHNQEQARRDEMHVQENKEQEARNEAQARLNDLQAKKNQAQEIKNEEQARLNEIQARKNQEQAAKNTVSVQ